MTPHHDLSLGTVQDRPPHAFTDTELTEACAWAAHIAQVWQARMQALQAEVRRRRQEELFEKAQPYDPTV